MHRLERERALVDYDAAAQAWVDAATRLQQARREVGAGGVVAAPYHEVTEALDRLVAVAHRGLLLAADGRTVTGGRPTWTGAARGWYARFEAAREARQAHLLAAGPETAPRQPDVVPIDGTVDLGPFWPLTDYLDIRAQPPSSPQRRLPADAARARTTPSTRGLPTGDGSGGPPLPDPRPPLDAAERAAWPLDRAGARG